MTTKELDKFFKKANKIISSYEDKLSSLNYDCFIIASVVFTSDTDYYYLFSVFKDNQIIEKVSADSKDYNKIFKDLSIKYKTNIIYNYNDLNSKQLKYLDSLNDNYLNKDEIGNILFKRQLDLI